MTLGSLKEMLNSRNTPYQISINSTVISNSETFNSINNNYISNNIYYYNNKFYQIMFEYYNIENKTYLVEVFVDVTELIKTIQNLKEENDKLRKDFVTGLSTRCELDNFLIKLNNESVIVMCDIDNFKAVNDIYGHLIGDKVLKTLGEIIKSNIRKSDYLKSFAGRYGGEEFLIIFETNNIESVKERIDRINYEFNTCGILPNLSFSAGISLFNGTKHVRQVIEEADIALYEAKNTGKNKCVIYKQNKLKYKKEL